MTSLYETPKSLPVSIMTFPEMQDDDEAQQHAAREDAARREMEQRVADREAEWNIRLRQEREQVAAQVREECELRYRESLNTERTAIAMACTSFAHAREKYFREVESEVVRLALSIAGRALHREVATDPLALEGVVRVALDRLHDPKDAVLRVPLATVDLWHQCLKHQLQIEGDPYLAETEVELRTPSATAQLGIAAQLEEIERGFCDLLAKRPA